MFEKNLPIFAPIAQKLRFTFAYFEGISLMLGLYNALIISQKHT
jgi:hypothetical protein